MTLKKPNKNQQGAYASEKPKEAQKKTYRVTSAAKFDKALREAYTTNQKAWKSLANK